MIGHEVPNLHKIKEKIKKEVEEEYDELLVRLKRNWYKYGGVGFVFGTCFGIWVGWMIK